MSLMECGKCFCEQGENNSIVDWDKWLCQTLEGRENAVHKQFSQPAMTKPFTEKEVQEFI